MRINWWGAFLFGLGLTSLLLPWGQYYDGAHWQSASLVELLGRTGDGGLTLCLWLFLISTLITARTTWGGVGQVIFSILVVLTSRPELTFPPSTLGVVGIPFGPFIGLVVGLLELYLLTYLRWTYVVRNDSNIPKPGPFDFRKENPWR